MICRAKTRNDRQGDLILRVHNWKGEVTKETTILAAAFGGSISIRGSSIAICVGGKPNLLIEQCHASPLTQIVTWNIDSGVITRTEIPQDERAPLCVSYLTSSSASSSRC